jgi:hypothetical protein
MEELELISLLADHPMLIATAEADKAFCLLTDARLRAMYSAARDGLALLELAPAQLPPPTAQHVLSGKYASAKDPVLSLAAMTRNLEARKANAARMAFRKGLIDAGRRGDQQLAREMSQRASAAGISADRGNHELVMKLADERMASAEKSASLVDPETSNRKQVE